MLKVNETKNLHRLFIIFDMVRYFCIKVIVLNEPQMENEIFLLQTPSTFGYLPANIKLKTTVNSILRQWKWYFSTKFGLLSLQEGPFLGAVLPCSLYFSDPASL
jgi:hypothetical protein